MLLVREGECKSSRKSGPVLGQPERLRRASNVIDLSINLETRGASAWPKGSGEVGLAMPGFILIHSYP